MTLIERKLNAVVLDWAGTTVDHGSCAPAIVFQEIFRRRGVPITAAQAREPMGRAKRDHIATIAAMQPVHDAWIDIHSQACGEADIDSMYADFLPLQKETLRDHCVVIPGVTDAVTQLRQRGLKIGSTTGYTRELMEVVTASAKTQGYAPDLVLSAEDAPRGRPAPDLLFLSAMQLGAYPMWSIVKVDDTPVGIEAGRNAGCWTVGITRTGNGVGRSLAEIEAMSREQVAEVCEVAAAPLRDSGAHFLLETVAELPALLDEIEQRLATGLFPDSPSPA